MKFDRAELLAKRKSDARADAGKKRAKSEVLPSPPAPPAKGTVAPQKETATPSRADKKPMAGDAVPSSSTAPAVTPDDIRELKDLISRCGSQRATDPEALIKTLSSDFNAFKDDMASQLATHRDALVTRMVEEIGGVNKKLNALESGLSGLHGMHKDLAATVSKNHSAVIDALKPVAALEQRLTLMTEKQKATLTKAEDFYGEMKAVFRERDNCCRINEELQKHFEDAQNMWEVKVAKNLESGIIDEQRSNGRDGTHSAPHK